uniref:Uncharacterized protein n=1 Tax=Solanum lycopersicum TaxID=4081 RepID=A0A3Q7GMB4_SOLLC
MPAEVPTPPANVSSVHVSSQVTKDKFVYPDIEEMKQHMKEYVDSKFEYLVNLIKANQIEVMNSKNREDGQQPNIMYFVIMLRTDLMKEMDDKSTSHMVEVSDEEGNDGHQTEDTLKNHQVMKDISELQSPNANSHHTDETCEHRKDALSAQTPHHLFEGTMNEDVSYNVQHNTNQLCQILLYLIH